MYTKISVIVPTYAPKDYLWECLDSLENQTLPKAAFEVIIVLNGERQPYEDMIVSKMSQYSFRYLLLYSCPKGVSNARNLALENAKGEYIGFIDDDDWVSPNYLESLLANACNDCIVVANVKVIDEKTKTETDRNYIGKAFANYQQAKGTNQFANRSFFSTSWCKLIPAKIAKSQQFNANIKRGEDSVYMFGLAWQIKRIKVTKPSCIYYVRRRQNSAGTRSINFSTKLFEFISQSTKYTCMYVKHMPKYELAFFLSRIAGTFYNKFILH